MLSHLHGLDEGDVFGGEGVEGGQSSLECRKSLRQIPLTLILDGLRLCGCFVGHCLICSHYLEVYVLGSNTTTWEQFTIWLHVHQFLSPFLLSSPSLPLPSPTPSPLLPDLFLCLCLDSVSFNLHHELLCFLLCLHQLWLQFLELLLHHRHL